MNREDIIRMAREAAPCCENEGLVCFDHNELERFAALVAAAEREACAKFVEDGYVRQFERPWREDLAAAMRARGQA